MAVIFWDQLIDEMRTFGKDYMREQLADFDWCIKELSNLGYATNIRYITRAYAKHLFGREPDYPAGVNAYYTYLLWGPRYPDGHSSPLCEDIQQAILVALYNICRLDHEDVQQAQQKTKH